MAKKIMLTEEDLHSLEEELRYLKGEKREEMAEKIKLARSYGDLSENSEYDDAKNEQAIMEARIRDIEAMLKSYELIDESDDNAERVRIGTRVQVEMLATGSTRQFDIVGVSGINPSAGRISDESPVGSALIGHVVGDVVEADAPSGSIGMKILEIGLTPKKGE
ncbi:MAG: transcription elongation factor GreA [Ruminococcus sp.]|jgi:transcription elongation factor GreA|nr:transcription elongation factor GreA [Ruminococcus sp.]